MRLVFPVVLTLLQLTLIGSLKFLDAFDEIVFLIIVSIAAGLYLKRNTDYKVLGNGLILSGSISALYTAAVMIWITIGWKG